MNKCKSGPQTFQSLSGTFRNAKALKSGSYTIMFSIVLAILNVSSFK